MSDDFVFNGSFPWGAGGLTGVLPIPGSDMETILNGGTVYRDSTSTFLSSSGNTVTIRTTTGTDGSSESYVVVGYPDGVQSDTIPFDTWAQRNSDLGGDSIYRDVNDQSRYWISMEFGG